MRAKSKASGHFQELPHSPHSHLCRSLRELYGGWGGGCGCLGGRILPGCWPLQDFTLPAKGRIPVFAFCILHLGANRLRHPKETKTSYRKWQRRQQGRPVFKPLAPRMTALQSLGTPGHVGWQSYSPVSLGGPGRTEIAGHCTLPDPRESMGARPDLD